MSTTNIPEYNQNAPLNHLDVLKLKHTQNWGTREERMKRRNETVNSVTTVEELCAHIQKKSLEESYWVDWSEHENESYYFSFSHNAFVIFDNYENERDKNIIR